MSLSPTFGQIIGHQQERCAQCPEWFQAPQLDLRSESHTSGGIISTRICPRCQAAQDGGLYVDRKPRPAELRKGWEDLCDPKYRNLIFERLPQPGKRAYEAVMGWRYRDDGQGLGLIGPSDGGKSYLIHAVARGLHLEGADIHLTYATKFAHDMSSLSAGPLELDRCCMVPWLLVDDVGKAAFNANQEAKFYHVLETRERFQRPMLITVNSTGTQLAGLMSEDRALPIVNRLRRLCQFIEVE